MKNDSYTYEEWKWVKGYVGLYLVSNMGRVMALNYLNRGIVHTLKVSSNGRYQKVTLRAHDGKQKTHYVHRLVAEAFIPNPENKPEVDHISGDTNFNMVEGLRWVSSKENSNNPITKPKLKNRYQDPELEFKHRSEGQKRRWKENPESFSFRWRSRLRIGQ